MKRVAFDIEDGLHETLMQSPAAVTKIARWALTQLASNLDLASRAAKSPDQYQILVISKADIPKHEPGQRQITGFVRQDRTSRTWHVDAPGCPTLESMMVDGYTAQTYPYGGHHNYDPGSLPHLRVKTRSITFARPHDIVEHDWEPIWVLIQDVAYACDVDPELLRVLFPEQGLHIQVHGTSWEDHKSSFLFLIQHLNPKMPEKNIISLHDQIRREWITPGYKIPPPY